MGKKIKKELPVKTSEEFELWRKIALFCSFLFVIAGFYGLSLLKTEVNSSYMYNLPVYLIIIGYVIPIFALKS